MKFRPLHARVVIKRLEGEEKSKGGIIIPDSAKEKPQEGMVVAVGPGGRDEAGKLLPIDLRVGDKVLFGKWSGTEVKIDGEDLLIIQADADDLVAEVRAPGSEPRMIGLKKGDNSVEVASGSVQVSVQTKGGKKVSDSTVDVAPGGEAKLAVRSRGTVVIQVPADADVTVGGKDVEGQEGKFTVELEPGAHSLVVQRPGHFGQKGDVTVIAGKTATVAPQLESYDYGGKKTYAYAAILGGGALVVAAIALDALGSYDEFGGDVTRWSLLGLGAAGFVGGTIMLKHTLDEAAPIKDVRYDVKIARLQGGAVASLGLRF